MIKTIRKFLCAIVLSLVVVFAAACTFFDSEEARQIANIYSMRGEENGVQGTYIVIEYNEDYGTDRFFVADPEPGAEGNGIASITSKQSEDGAYTILTITYTDISRPEAEIRVPNGKYITNIDFETDEETNVVTLKIYLSGDSDPLEIPIQPGKDGKDGIDGDTIQEIYTTEDDEGNLVVHIIVKHYNEEEEIWEEIEMHTFTVPKGERGNGIVSISVNWMTYDDPNNMYLDIIYDDGSYETIMIPRANSWYTGMGEPNAAWYSMGDFYFDTVGFAIWHKETTGWVKLVDFSGFSAAEHTVYFYLDNGITLSGFTRITHGNNFLSANETLPTPSIEGYKFLGWYTEYIETDGEPSPNAAHFDVLTPVLSNITLYARWATAN